MKIDNDMLSRALDKTIEQYIKENDLEKVRHGKWIKDVSKRRGDGEIYDYMCNICGTPAVKSGYRNCDVFLAYCPHCGAKMDGKEN